MKWISLNTLPAAVRLYHLSEDNKVKETLRYNPLQQSIRLSNSTTQRVFFIEQSGFRNNHFIFKNEYGFETGRIYVDTLNNNDGMVEFGEFKMQYALFNNPVSEMVIYQPDGLTPRFVCDLQQEGDGKIIFGENNKAIIFGYACLLWGLCWYSYNTLEKEISTGNDRMLLFA